METKCAGGHKNLKKRYKVFSSPNFSIELIVFTIGTDHFETSNPVQQVAFWAINVRRAGNAELKQTKLGVKCIR